MVPVIEERYPLTDLDGLNIWWQARLVEEGVEDMQHLTTANLVELMLHTRMPVTRMVDWIDQAFLYLRVGEHRSRRHERQAGAGVDERAQLRAHGIRTATDLLDVLDHAEVDTEVRAVLTSLLHDEHDGYQRLRCLRRSLDGEVNLRHVRTWKQAAWLERVTAPPTGSPWHPPPAPAGVDVDLSESANGA